MARGASEGFTARIRVLPVHGDPVDVPPEAISGFEFDDRSKGADKVLLEVENGDLRWLRETVFVKGNRLRVTWGYPSRLAVPRLVKIRKVTGFDRLKVEAYGRELDFHAQKIARTWRDMALGDIVSTVATENGFDDQVVTTVTGTRARVQQARMTDAQFLQWLADRYGAEWYIDAAGTFHFHPRDFDQVPQRTFRWRGLDRSAGIIGKPTFEHSILNRPSAVRVVAVDHLDKRVREVTADNTTARTSLGDATELESTDEPADWRVDPKRAEVLDLHAWSSLADMQARADAQYRLVQATQVKCRLKVEGDPYLTAKALVRLEDFGVLLSGPYYVVRARHRGRGGYVIDLELRRDAVNRLGGRNAQPATDGGRVNRERAPAEPVTPAVDIQANIRAAQERRGLRFRPDIL